MAQWRHFANSQFCSSHMLAALCAPQHRGGAYSAALQMRGWWESNINVWFPFMYSRKWNCYFRNRIIIFCLSVPIHSNICVRLIYFQDRSAYSAAGKYVDQSWEYINHSQTRECKNCAIPRKGIHKWDFPCSAAPIASPHWIILPFSVRSSPIAQRFAIIFTLENVFLLPCLCTANCKQKSYTKSDCSNHS